MPRGAPPDEPNPIPPMPHPARPADKANTPRPRLADATEDAASRYEPDGNIGDLKRLQDAIAVLLNLANKYATPGGEDGFRFKELRDKARDLSKEISFAIICSANFEHWTQAMRAKSETVVEQRSEIRALHEVTERLLEATRKAPELPAGSSNGRAPGFGPGDTGSTPVPATEDDLHG